MKTNKRLFFESINLHTCALNQTDYQISLVADGVFSEVGVEKEEYVTMHIYFRDEEFLEFISHKEIDKIKENLKKRIGNL